MRRQPILATAALIVAVTFGGVAYASASNNETAVAADGNTPHSPLDTATTSFQNRFAEALNEAIEAEEQRREQEKVAAYLHAVEQQRIEEERKAMEYLAAVEEAERQKREAAEAAERERREREAAAAAAQAPAVAAGNVWDRLAECESGGNWHINTGNGYYGGLQFSLSSWQAVGGTGYPHEHSREVQIQMGERLRAQGGWGHWPACSKKLGLR